VDDGAQGSIQLHIIPDQYLFYDRTQLIGLLMPRGSLPLDDEYKEQGGSVETVDNIDWRSGFLGTPTGKFRRVGNRWLVRTQ